MRRPTVLLVDDHVPFTRSVLRILKDHFDVLGMVTDGDAVLEAATRLRPDVIITDISMPALSGIDGLRQLKAHHNQARIIFLTMHADADLAAAVLRLGADGFVLKQASGTELVKAIDTVVGGQKYLSSALRPYA